MFCTLGIIIKAYNFDRKTICFIIVMKLFNSAEQNLFKNKEIKWLLEIDLNFTKTHKRNLWWIPDVSENEWYTLMIFK